MVNWPAVTWRESNNPPDIQRSTLTSTCERWVARQLWTKSGRNCTHTWELDQNKRRSPSQVRTIHRMEAGVYGGWTIDRYCLVAQVLLLSTAQHLA